MERFARFAVFYGVLIGSWFLLVKLKVWSPNVFPSPQGVMEALWSGFVGVSMQRVLLGNSLSGIFWGWSWPRYSGNHSQPKDAHKFGDVH
jgi:ABC-type nitrate/sulfonate/bicarbonate transport system permease component